MFVLCQQIFSEGSDEEDDEDDDEEDDGGAGVSVCCQGQTTAPDLDAACRERPNSTLDPELCVFADTSKQQPKKHTASFVTNVTTQAPPAPCVSMANLTRRP